MLQELNTLAAFHIDTAHVGHVKDGAVLAASQMLGDDADGVLDGHFPATEVHQSGTCFHMGLIINGTFQSGHF